jgi:hypothetical protein
MRINPLAPLAIALFFAGTLLAVRSLAAAPSAYTVLDECPDMEPSTNTFPEYGAVIRCPDGTVCGQNYSISYEYACDLPSPGKKCVPGQVLSTKYKEYTCTAGCQGGEWQEIHVTGMVAANCEDPGPDPPQ